MSTINELKEKRSTLLSQAQQVALQDVKDVQELEKLERMLADVDLLEKQIDLAERAEAKLSEERSRTKPPRSNPDARQDAGEKEARSKAFEKYVRFGKDELTSEERTLLRQGEKRDLLTSGTGPAYLIPQEYYTTLIEAQKYVGAILNEVTRKETNNNGAPMKIALANDTSNILTTMTEGVSLSETDPSFTGFILSTDTVATMVKASVQELEDSYFNLDAWLRQKFGVRYARGLDQYILQGNGSNVASLASSAASALTVTSAASTGPVYNDFTAVYGALDAAYVYNAKWAFNQATRAYIMGLKDNYGRPLFIVSPNSGTLDQILGQDVVITPNLPNAYANTSTSATVNGILFGDFEQGYVFRTDGPLAIRRLDERFMDALEVGFIAYSRIGGAFTDAGTHPVAALITPAA
jgi:HK97 family phage major capsid protein